MILSTMNDLPGYQVTEVIEAAQAKGAETILAMRFDVNELQNIGQEICAYGTAVKIRRSDT
jgi:uncharacterized protein YbjQ (UPF0145 family)